MRGTASRQRKEVRGKNEKDKKKNENKEETGNKT